MLGQLQRKWTDKPAIGTLVAGGHPLAKELLACWLFNQGRGRVWDYGKARAHGTLTGSNITWGTYLEGYEARYTATSGTSYVGTGNTSTFNFERTQPVTFELMVYIASTTAIDAFGNGNAAGTRGWWVQLNKATAGKVQVYLANTATNAIIVYTTNADLTNNAWNHVTVTYDGSSTAGGVKIYVNGRNRTLTTGTNALSATTQTGVEWTIGRSGASTTGSQNGTRYAWHRIWTRVLSAEEIRLLFDQPFAMFGSPAVAGLNGLSGLKFGSLGMTQAEALTSQPRRVRRQTLTPVQAHVWTTQARRSRRGIWLPLQTHAWSAMGRRIKRALATWTQSHLWTGVALKIRRGILAMAHAQSTALTARRQRRGMTHWTQTHGLTGVFRRLRHGAVSGIQSHQATLWGRRLRRAMTTWQQTHIWTLSTRRLRRAIGTLGQIHQWVATGVVTGGLAVISAMFLREHRLRLPGSTRYRPTDPVLYRLPRMTAYTAEAATPYVSNRVTRRRKHPR